MSYSGIPHDETHNAAFARVCSILLQILKQQVSSSGNVLHWEVARPQEELLDEDIDIVRQERYLFTHACAL